MKRAVSRLNLTTSNRLQPRVDMARQKEMGAGRGASRPPTAATKSRLLRVLGPGLITGASDDDPSGIATYSQAGAQFGYAIT